MRRFISKSLSGTPTSSSTGIVGSSASSPFVLLSPTLPLMARSLALSGRVTNEDRRWWLVHLECMPDVTPGTFVSFLDCCGTHTTKKLIERNVWTIEQLAALDSDTIDDLKYGHGCLKIDVAWEQARTILTPLRQREVRGGVESELQSKILALRKQRELEKQRATIVEERAQTMESREETLRKLRESIAAKKAELLKKQQAAAAAKQQQQQESGEGQDQLESGNTVASTVADMSQEEGRADGSRPPQS